MAAVITVTNNSCHYHHYVLIITLDQKTVLLRLSPLTLLLASSKGTQKLVHLLNGHHREIHPSQSTSFPPGERFPDPADRDPTPHTGPSVLSPWTNNFWVSSMEQQIIKETGTHCPQPSPLEHAHAQSRSEVLLQGNLSAFVPPSFSPHSFNREILFLA